MAYQFKVILQDIEPPIWRRIVVPKQIHFADFGYAILDSMGWCTTCYFRLHINKSIMIPDFPEGKVEEMYDHFIKDYLDCEIEVEYDFEMLEVNWDGAWFHTVEFEGEVEPPEGFRDVVSMCLDGARACPPDYTKYSEGYKVFLEGIADKNDPDKIDRLLYENCVDYDDRDDFDPEYFDVKSIQIKPARPVEMLLDFTDNYKQWLKSIGL